MEGPPRLFKIRRAMIVDVMDLDKLDGHYRYTDQEGRWIADA